MPKSSMILASNIKLIILIEQDRSEIIEYMLYQWRKFTKYLNLTKYEDPRKVEKKINALYRNNK